MVQKDSRTEISDKLGFNLFYVYTAANTTGASFTIIADALNKNTLQVFLDEFAKTLTKKII